MKNLLETILLIFLAIFQIISFYEEIKLNKLLIEANQVYEKQKEPSQELISWWKENKEKEEVKEK